MTEKLKKKRSTNFNNDEKVLLIEQVKCFSNIIESKGLDPNLHKKKLEAWRKISLKFNSLGYDRSSVKLRDTYQRLKHQAKVVIRDYKKAQTGTGGGPRPNEPSDLDYAIMDISPKDFISDEGAIDSDFFRIDSNCESKFEPDEESFILDPFSGELRTTTDEAIPSTSQISKCDNIINSKPRANMDDNLITSQTSSQVSSRGGNDKKTSYIGFSGQSAKKKKISCAEIKLVEYHEKRLEHLIETHSVNLKYLEYEEQRKNKLLEKEMEKKKLEIELLKQQLEQQQNIYLKSLEIKTLEIMTLKKQ